MLSNFNNSQEILEVAQKELLYEKLLLQIKKDFELANAGLKFNMDIEPDKLKSILHEKIYFLMLEKFQEYLNLLYVVDIPESAVKEIQATDVVDVSAEVCFLLLKREWQKVWFKNKYAS
ncbi:hypothetical protein FVB32_02230 [Flagellimonas hymeniacidonis]|uniref:Uncharacterized protein n=1 Tax=Flagellimonas hymeniacidonis TaxID=2603628 RepID=A0A5C8V8Q4_9FLAO|nr:hypothetical protein [Flagellimonas hymeniacidonis]TXN37128.1 hypothetical protein FVB32_02230 [Flagellimonas hymeniacidonis]